MIVRTGSLRRATGAHGRAGSLRSAGAAAAGLLAIVTLCTATDAVLNAPGVSPPPRHPLPDGLLLLVTENRVVSRSDS